MLCDGGFHIIYRYEGLKHCPICDHHLPPEDFEGDQCLICARQWADGLLPLNIEGAKNKAVIRLVTRIKNPLRQRCSFNGCKELGERHHRDYSKPNDFMWLCKKHHWEMHREIKALKLALGC